MKLSPVQNRALFKLAVDLVKADDQIHYDEIAVLHDLQTQCNITADEIELIHYISLQEAIDILSLIDQETIDEIIETLSNIISIDNDIDYRENLLLSSIKLCLNKHNGFKIISTQDATIDCDFNQMIYLEHQPCACARTFFQDTYDYMMFVNALSKINIQFFYLPRIIELLQSDKRNSNSFLQTLQHSIHYIVPSHNTTDIEQLDDTLQDVDVVGFTKLVETKINIQPEQVRMEAYLLVMIHDSNIFDDENICHRNKDFLCINVSENPKLRVLQFIELMLQPQQTISYHGYYRLLFDFLNSGTPITSNILIKSNHSFVLEDLGNMDIHFKSAPQAKTFYLLLLFCGKSGINQKLCEKAQKECDRLLEKNTYDILDLKLLLLQQHTEEAITIYNTIIIYETISHKNVDSHRMLEYVRSILCHRSSLKNYINTTFLGIENLANKEMYLIKYNKLSETYHLDLNSIWIQIEQSSNKIPITESKMWQKLVRFSNRLEL
jgi:hypothetical protein